VITCGSASLYSEKTSVKLARARQFKWDEHFVTSINGTWVQRNPNKTMGMTISKTKRLPKKQKIKSKKQ